MNGKGGWVEGEGEKIIYSKRRGNKMSYGRKGEKKKNLRSNTGVEWEILVYWSKRKEIFHKNQETIMDHILMLHFLSKHITNWGIIWYESPSDSERSLTFDFREVSAAESFSRNHLSSFWIFHHSTRNYGVVSLAVLATDFCMENRYCSKNGI